MINELSAITPLDGRYREKIAELSNYTSEFAAIKIRCEVEIKYLMALSQAGIVRKFSKKEINLLETFYKNFDLKKAAAVKEIEKTTRHDVKALERLIRKELSKTSLKDVVEMVHFGITSEDIDNISYRLMLERGVREVIIPILAQVVKELVSKASENKEIVMIGRTHGQPAVPTTLGKEFVVFVYRLNNQILKLKKQKLSGKLTGAIGNFNALTVAFPKVSWINFSKRFVSSLGLSPNLITTQLNPYDDVAEYLQTIERINNILIGLSQDIWLYISDFWLIQIPKSGEVGSSTMPQKVNPIDFENCEGNLGVANTLLEHFSRKLTISRLQRDLSGSTVIRSIGAPLGHSLMGYKSLLVGLSRIRPNRDKISEDLNRDWSVLTEAAQILLRREKVNDPYSLIADLSRGKRIGKEEWIEWIHNLPVSDSQREMIKKITPENYIGLASELVDRAVKEIKSDK